MRKWAVRILISITAAAAVIAAALVLDAMDKQSFKTRIKNDELPVIKPGWEGNPVDERDRFINNEFPYVPRVIDILKWKVVDGNPFKQAKQDDPRRVEVKDPGDFLNGVDDGIMWMGHASFLIRVDGKTILTDPVFGEPSFLKRFVPVPSPIGGLRSVDLILISHDHRDHMDEESIRALAAKFPEATIIAGLRSEELLREWAPSNPIVTIGWYQRTTVVNDIRITFVPVRHWSRRGLFDTNWRLWGGFVIEAGAKKIYFGGDSGYGRHYREVGELFPNIDYFIVGIGAYEPRWFMEPNHNTPQEAIKGFRDIGAATLVPMHYGTFDLSDEPPGAPLETLLNEAEGLGLRDRVRPLAIYEYLPLR